MRNNQSLITGHPVTCVPCKKPTCCRQQEQHHWRGHLRFISQLIIIIIISICFMWLYLLKAGCMFFMFALSLFSIQCGYWKEHCFDSKLYVIHVSAKSFLVYLDFPQLLFLFLMLCCPCEYQVGPWQVWAMLHGQDELFTLMKVGNHPRDGVSIKTQLSKVNRLALGAHLVVKLCFKSYQF